MGEPSDVVKKVERLQRISDVFMSVLYGEALIEGICSLKDYLVSGTSNSEIEVPLHFTGNNYIAEVLLFFILFTLILRFGIENYVHMENLLLFLTGRSSNGGGYARGQSPPNLQLGRIWLIDFIFMTTEGISLYFTASVTNISYLNLFYISVMILLIIDVTWIALLMIGDVLKAPLFVRPAIPWPWFILNMVTIGYISEILMGFGPKELTLNCTYSFIVFITAAFLDFLFDVYKIFNVNLVKTVRARAIRFHKSGGTLSKYERKSYAIISLLFGAFVMLSVVVPLVLSHLNLW